MHTSPYMTTAQPLARALYVILFNLNPLNEDGNWLVYMYGILYACEKEPLKSPERTSEHVKSQNFLGACPRTPLIQSIAWAPLFVFALGPHNPLGSLGGVIMLNACRYHSQ